MPINFLDFLFDLDRKMWGLLDTSHALLTDNDNLENKPYVCLGLLDNLADLLVVFDARSIIIGIFDPFSPSRDGI